MKKMLAFPLTYACTPFNCYNTLNRCLVVMCMRLSVCACVFDVHALRVIAFMSILLIVVRIFITEKLHEGTWNDKRNIEEHL